VKVEKVAKNGEKGQNSQPLSPFWPNLMAPDKVVKVTGVTDFTEIEITTFFDAQEVRWNECKGPNPDDCFDRQETVGSMGGTTFLGFDADDPDAAEVDFPGLEELQVNMFLSSFVHMSLWCWECEKSEIASKISIRYMNCNAALSFSPTLGIPPLARDNIARYFANFHNDPNPGNNQIRSDMKLTGIKSAVSKNVSDTCKMLVTLVDVPIDPQELVSGAKGVVVLHNFPIFRQFFHFHENPSSSVISSVTFSRGD